MHSTVRARAVPRGSTLLEVLMAGAILIIGLTGVVSMMLRSSSSTRDGATLTSAAAYGSASLQELTALGFANLAVTGGFDGGSGFIDAGIVYDGAGRRYGRLISVANAGSAGAPAYLVTVQVQWRDSLGVPRTTTSSTLVGRSPDAGP